MGVIALGLLVVVAHQLGRGCVGEDIVDDLVAVRVAVAMQMEPAVLRAVDDVVLHPDFGTAGVQVDAPATVALLAPLEAGDIVDQVVVQHRARRHAQGVDAADVIEHPVAQVVDVVVGDFVVVGARGALPGPAPAQVDAHPA